MFTLLDLDIEYFSTEEFQRGSTTLKEENNHFIYNTDSQDWVRVNMHKVCQLHKYLYSLLKGFILLSVPDFLFWVIQE